MTKYIVSYAYGKEFEDNMNSLHTKALLYGGIDKSIKWNLKKLKKTPFYKKDTSEHFKKQPGNGFYCWKPFVILQALKSVKDGDWIIYHDAGKSSYNYPLHCFNEDISSLLSIIDKEYEGFLPGFYIRDNHSEWCKYDCLKLMDCDNPQCLTSKQLNSCFIIVKKGSKNSEEFLNEWLKNCLDINKISNDEITNYKYPIIQEHRYDQAILTNLAINHELNLPNLTKYTNIKLNGFTYDLCRRYYPVFEKCLQDTIDDDLIRGQLLLDYSDSSFNFIKRHNLSLKLFEKYTDDFNLNTQCGEDNRIRDFIIRVSYPFDIKIPKWTKFLFVILDKDLLIDSKSSINNLEELNKADINDNLYFIVNDNYYNDIKSFINGLNIKFTNFITYGKHKSFEMVIKDIISNIVKPCKFYNKLLETNNIIDIKNLLENAPENLTYARFVDSNLHMKIQTLSKIEFCKSEYELSLPKFKYPNPLKFLFEWENTFIEYLEYLKITHKSYPEQANLLLTSFFDKMNKHFLNKEFSLKLTKWIRDNLDYLVFIKPFYNANLYTQILNLDYDLGKLCRQKINKMLHKMWNKQNLDINLVNNNRMAVIFKQDDFFKGNAVFKFIQNQLEVLSEQHEFDLYITEYNDNFEHIINTNPIKHLFKNIYKLSCKYDHLHKLFSQSNSNDYIYNAFPGIQNLIENNYGKLYYITIGMEITQIYLSNLQIAPIQMSGYSHLYSSFGSKLNRFICSREVEKDTLDYSEEIIWMDDLTSKPKLQENFLDMTNDYIPNKEAGIIDIGINCKLCKMDYRFLEQLKKIGDEYSKVVFSFFIGEKFSNNIIIGLKSVLLRMNIRHHIYFMNDTFKEYIHKKLNMNFYIDSSHYGGFTTIIENIQLGKLVVVSDKGETTSLKMARYILMKYNQSEYIGDIYEKSKQIIINIT